MLVIHSRAHTGETGPPAPACGSAVGTVEGRKTRPDLLAMRGLADGAFVSLGTTALLGLGQALDDDNVGQFGELIRVEQ
jgi:hypothetical protein